MRITSQKLLFSLLLWQWELRTWLAVWERRTNKILLCSVPESLSTGVLSREQQALAGDTAYSPREIHCPQRNAVFRKCFPVNAGSSPSFRHTNSGKQEEQGEERRGKARGKNGYQMILRERWSLGFIRLGQGGLSSIIEVLNIAEKFSVDIILKMEFSGQTHNWS